MYVGFLKDMFAKTRAEPNNIPTGRQTKVNGGYSSTLSPHRSRTNDVLKTLRSIPEESAAIEYLKRTNPDVSMAVWNFVRLANQGNETHFYDLDGKTRRTDLEGEWRDFASRINEISNSGLDGLIDQLHYSSFLLGAMGVEVEVTDDRNDIYDVYPVKPQSIEWELKDVDSRKKWVPYQYGENGSKKVYLDKKHANFFWVPADPEISDPRGTLTMSPALQAIDFQMQILQDLQAVLHHQGYPKNDISIALERMMGTCPPHIKNDPKKLNEWLDNQYNEIVHMMENIDPDSDYIHFDDITIGMNVGANAGRSLDVRAINELVDVQVLNGLKQLGTFANRSAGKTETWSTVEFLIMTQGIKSCQRGSKRLIEEIARLWLRVNGKQAIVTFQHGVVNWQSEEDKQTVALMKQEYYAIAQMMGWIDKDSASQEVMGNQNANSDPITEIKVNFSSGGGKVETDKHSGKDKKSSSEKSVI